MKELIDKLKTIDIVHDISLEEGFNGWNSHKVLNRVMYNILHMEEESTGVKENKGCNNLRTGLVECSASDEVACLCLCNTCDNYTLSCCERNLNCPITECVGYIKRG